jgi:hypothetical protein
VIASLDGACNCEWCGSGLEKFEEDWDFRGSGLEKFEEDWDFRGSGLEKAM